MAQEETPPALPEITFDQEKELLKTAFAEYVNAMLLIHRWGEQAQCRHPTEAEELTKIRRRNKNSQRGAGVK